MRTKIKVFVLVLGLLCTSMVFPGEGTGKSFFSEANINYIFLYGRSSYFENQPAKSHEEIFVQLTGQGFECNILFGLKPELKFGVGATVIPVLEAVYEFVNTATYVHAIGQSTSLKLFLEFDLSLPQLVSIKFDVGMSYNLTAVGVHTQYNIESNYPPAVSTTSITPFGNVKLVLKEPEGSFISVSLGWGTLLIRTQACGFITGTAGVGISF